MKRWNNYEKVISTLHDCKETAIIETYCKKSGRFDYGRQQKDYFNR